MTYDPRILAIMDEIGQRYTTERPPGRVTAWDGRTVCLPMLCPPDRGAGCLAHELAHFAVAPPTRRSLPSYGLGHGPDDDLGSEEPMVAARAADEPYPRAPHEESGASALGIAVEAGIGSDWRATLDFHCWHDITGCVEAAREALALPWLPDRVRRLAEKGIDVMIKEETP